MIWAGVLAASAACYGLKLAGLSLPQNWLHDARVQRAVPLLPVALLAALVATQTFSTGHHLVLDVRAAALGVVPGRGRLRRGHRRGLEARLVANVTEFVHDH